MFEDPAKRQYLMFSAVIAIMFSFIIQFGLAGSIEGPYVEGFPFSVFELTGFEALLKRAFNTLFMAAFLVVPIYYLLMWGQNRR